MTRLTVIVQPYSWIAGGHLLLVCLCVGMYIMCACISIFSCHIVWLFHNRILLALYTYMFVQMFVCIVNMAIRCICIVRHVPCMYLCVFVCMCGGVSVFV